MEAGTKTIDRHVPPEDLEAITRAAHDYIEGWYSADPVRMERCLHPGLVKRSIFRGSQDSALRLGHSTNASMMVEFTRKGGGSQTPKGAQTYELSNLDVFRHIACVKVVSHDFVDYLHLAKIEQSWVIVNVLWELKKGELTADD
jgi:hypothetical protein